MSYGRIVTALAYHVTHVVALAADEQVGGVAAGGVVAAVTNYLAGQHLAMGDDPGQPVGIGGLVAGEKSAVAVAPDGSFPGPARLRIGPIHEIPETFDNGGGELDHCSP